MTRFLVQEGEDLDTLQQLTELPLELLRDPTAWLRAREVENFLLAVENQYASKFSNTNLLETIGHQACELKAWGVLDSVLKMMSRPHDIFAQPERFLSYFISPPPPIGKVHRSSESIRFDIPISHEEFPCATAYMQAAIEALPTFVGHEHCQAKWEDTELSVSWLPAQERLFVSEEEGRNINPEFMRSLVEALENTEKALEEKKREIESIRSENEKASLSLLNEDVFQLEQPLSQAKQQFLKMSDYFTRSRQLITLLIGQDRMNAQVKEAMRRVDWENIEQQFGSVMEQGMKGLEETQEVLKGSSAPPETARRPSCPQLNMFTPEKF